MSDSSRIVLAFGASDGPLERVVKSLPLGARRRCQIRSGTGKISGPAARFAALRLEGETLVVAETDGRRIEPIVSALLEATPSVFVIRPDFEIPPDTEPEWKGLDHLRRRAILARLRQNKQAFERSRDELTQASKLEHAITKAAEWILDNSYLIHSQFNELRRHLPPTVSSGPSSENGKNIFRLARELAVRTDFAVNEDNIRSYLREVQTERTLTIGELWAFPLFLRITLIETVASISTRVSERQQLREAAYLWANRLATAWRTGEDAFERILHRLRYDPVARHPAFLTALAEQLQDEEPSLSQVQRWITDQFQSSLIDLVRAQHTKEAAAVVATANAFGSLRILAQLEFAEIFEEVSAVEAELRKDPGGIYGRSDFQTRDRCRRVVEQIALASHTEEKEVAQRAIDLAAQADDSARGHVAWYLLADGITRVEALTGARISTRVRILRAAIRHATPVYITSVLVLTVCLTAISSVLAWEAGIHSRAILIPLGVIAALILSELATQIVQALIIALVRPEPLPKLDYRDAIPAEDATLVVIPMMLTSPKAVRDEVRKLEVRYLGNRNQNLCFSLFSDFTDSDVAVHPDDAELLQTAVDGINRLNAAYPGDRFLLFHRPRSWSESEQAWIGRERKRGKIEDLNAFLAGDGMSDIVRAGRLRQTIAYVITLDSDTHLPPGTARRMIETISHPLNRAEINPATRMRTRGYTIIQPRISIALPVATSTHFTRIFADASGTDPYCSTVSDAHQDLFREAIYHGKAIYDVRAFHTILRDRFPSDTILSHDLIEGAHVGVGLASDIELFESLPPNYGSYATRQRRWIRGDWQILPWIYGRVPRADSAAAANTLTIINRWRIFDNLRRSLIPVAALLLLLFGWLISQAPLISTLVVGLAVAIPAFAPWLDRLARRMQGTIRGWQGAADDLKRTAVMIAFLPHQAWLSVDSIARVFYRRKISRRRMLEWHTAERARMLARHHLDATLRQMVVISVLSAALGAFLAIRGGLDASIVFIGPWILSPLLMRWLARPGEPTREKLRRSDAQFLHRTARRTWRYFDDLVRSDNNWLPPDNSQMALRIEVAQRTSPTNIGLWFTAALAAWDFGYLTADEMWERCAGTMRTLDRMERFDTHLLNWYDTRTLDPLTPRYISTVDSGNLVAALWVFAQGCQDVMRAPIIGHSASRGLADTLGVLRQAIGHDLSVAALLHDLHGLFSNMQDGHEFIVHLKLTTARVEKLSDAQRWYEANGDDRFYWASRLAEQLAAWNEAASRYLLWMETLASPPDSALQKLGADAVRLRRAALRHIPSISALAAGKTGAVDEILARRDRAGLTHELARWLDKLAAEYATAQANAAQSHSRIQALAAAAEDFAGSINLGFLYDRRRRLFGVGYAAGAQRIFTSHYDLLASECRLASLVAIAKGDVPVEHWFAMSRPWVESGRSEELLSWGGTMFEYLMPVLFTRTFTNSLLDRACHNAVERQIEYGQRLAIPWGISESAYSAIDAHEIYQYRAFGVPDLALNPGVESGPVVAPYATMLSLTTAPRDAVANLHRLEQYRMNGSMGFYESIDFAREAERGGKPGSVVHSFMAHHQAMSLLALDNALHRDILQRRFHRDARVRAVEPLLYERVPIVRMEMEEKKVWQSAARTLRDEEVTDRMWTDETTVPRVHLYGNGRYALMITNAGTGSSRWNEFDITRWRSDSVLDPWGTYIYLRDVRTNRVWAASEKPLAERLGENAARLAPDRAEFRRRASGIETLMWVTVSVEDDAEIRRLRIVNRTLRARQLDLTSYLELAMAPHGADRSHPAFSKMFIETECPEPGVLLAHRRARSPEEQPIWTAHALVGAVTGIQFETDRAKFLGRGNTTENPAALYADLTGSSGAVIDPIFSLRCRLELDSREQREISFVTAAGRTREEVLDLIHKHVRTGSAERAFEMAWTRSQLDLRFLGVGPAALHRYQELAGQLLYPTQRLRQGDRLTRNRLGQESLWAYGISGDLPILTVTVSESHHLPLMREAILAHTYWRMRGFRADLVILNQEGVGYDQPLRQQILRQIEAHAALPEMDRPGGVFLRDWHSIPEEGRDLLFAVSSIVLSGNRGPLQRQISPPGEPAVTPPFTPARAYEEEPSAPLPFLELSYFNGLGGFTRDGREYAIYLKPGTATPAPWGNVMANAGFGTMVTESGLGFTWRGNSQANRLTPWHNDPVSDPQSEVIFLRDEMSGAIWTPTVLPSHEHDPYRARHGQGYSVFEHNSHAIGLELTVFVPVRPDGSGDPVKISRLRLRSDSSQRRRIAVYFWADWVLGPSREDQQLHLHASRDEESGALLCRQYWKEAWAGKPAFAASFPRASSWTSDRAQFPGRSNAAARPAGLARARLDSRGGSGADSSAALQVMVNLEPGQVSEVTFLLGQADTIEDLRVIAGRYATPDLVETALGETRRCWDELLGAIQVRTPVPSVDLMLNRWLLYQALSCRFWGRSALYQSSGAFGFRDQLQDSMALLYAAPHLTRAHILTCARRQFAQGDVQHWWHAETGAGVRTRCSDDLLWLPFVVAQYVRVTGDVAILDESVPFLDGAELAEGEQEKFFIPTMSGENASLEEHCLRAIERGWHPGAHGLPLIGNGDWNDGMNLVGREGKGESVWLAWFICAVTESFGEVLQNRGRHPELLPVWNQRAEQLHKALETTGWDGDWYLRGFFDNGTPLGSHINEEACIDSLPQSWSAIANGSDPKKSRTAMESAERLLVREHDRLVLLFEPPFDHQEPNPGYIRGYPPGMRENGGQYTHGALWMAMAWARMGEGDRAMRLLQMMNPIELARTPQDVEKYAAEPYVVAADVSSTPGRVGRAGWTWYTGSAAWMYRIWVEEVLGFHLRGDRLTMKPAMPGCWENFSLTYRRGSTVYEIAVERHDAAELVTEVDGAVIESGVIQLRDTGGTRHIRIGVPHVLAQYEEPETNLARV